MICNYSCFQRIFNNTQNIKAYIGLEFNILVIQLWLYFEDQYLILGYNEIEDNMSVRLIIIRKKASDTIQNWIKILDDEGNLQVKHILHSEFKILVLHNTG